MSRNDAKTTMRSGVRQSRRWAIAALLLALIASIAMLFQPIAAVAEDTAAADPVAITVEQVGSTDEYKIKITNTGDQDMLSVSGTTAVPQEIAADGQSESVRWQTGALTSGQSAYVQSEDGRDVTVKVKSAETPSDKPVENPSDDTNNGKDTSTTDKQTAGSAKLSATGSAITVAALFAFALACIGVSMKWQNGRVAVRRTIAAVGSVAMIAAVATAATQQASAAQRTEQYSGIASAITVNGKDYQLTSDVTVAYDDDIVPTETTSIDYAKAMGVGWNLGNSFDGENTDLSVPDTGEEAWGNPKVTRELIHSIKEKGYTSIRMPMTVDRRSTENADAKDGEYRYVIDADWLARYKEVVDWAVDEGLYVMINVHHDSWIWLSSWNGDKSADEYRKYTDFWKQIAAYFADEPSTVSFETINEPQFNDGADQEKQDKLDAINKAAYDIIRATPGNEHRMIVLPTLGTAHDSTDKLQALVDFIKNDLNNDPCVLATVHYYSEWVYSANFGRTGFDESIYGDERTPRNVIDSFADRMNRYFTENGIGLVIGEYGLLAYDSSSDGALQAGEELKYYEYMGTMANENRFSYMFWDNGSGIDRTSYQWKKPLAGKMLEASINGRSSYATRLDTLYLEEDPTGDVKLPLTLNGNEFKGIEGLTEGSDYTYDAASATITLKQDYLAKMYEAKGGYGIIADLTLKFSAGADWHEYVVRSGTPAVNATGTVTGTKSEGLTIPMAFNGAELKNITATENGNRVGPNSGWWQYLQNSGSFSVHYDSADRASGTLTVLPAFFDDGSVTDGDVTFTITFQDGQTLDVNFNIAGEMVALK